MAAKAEFQKVVDIQKHILTPKHTILTPEEANEVLEKFNIAPLQLPVILSTDPIVKALGAKVGQIIKIERTGPTGKSLYYRLVVA